MNENTKIEDMAEALYTSPIELTQGDFYMQQDEGIYRAIYELGIVVDKDELIKALRYDREQYVRGFVDAYAGNIDKIKAEVAKEIFAELKTVMIDEWRYPIIAELKKKYLEVQE